MSGPTDYDSFWEHGWLFEWMGWRRMLWLSFQVDFANWAIGGVFFGLMVFYGPRLKECPQVFTRPSQDPTV